MVAPIQINKIQPFLSSVSCFTWTGAIPAAGAPGAEVPEHEAGLGGFPSAGADMSPVRLCQGFSPRKMSSC